MARLFTCMFAAFFLVGGGPAFAQAARPPAELGLGITGVANLNLGDFGAPARYPWADVRVTVPTSSRFAIEGTASVTRQLTSYSERVVTYHTIQVKQRIVTHTRRPGFHPFFTYGLLGAVEHSRFCPPNYKTHVSTQFSRPGGIAIGPGVEQALGSHVAVRADAQLLTFLWIPLGARFTGSVSIPFGRYDRP